MVLFCDGILLNERYPEEFAYDHQDDLIEALGGNEMIEEMPEGEFRCSRDNKIIAFLTVDCQKSENHFCIIK